MYVRLVLRRLGAMEEKGQLGYVKGWTDLLRIENGRSSTQELLPKLAVFMARIIERLN